MKEPDEVLEKLKSVTEQVVKEFITSYQTLESVVGKEEALAVTLSLIPTVK